jgi:hypothetical protein
MAGLGCFVALPTLLSPKSLAGASASALFPVSPIRSPCPPGLSVDGWPGLSSLPIGWPSPFIGLAASRAARRFSTVCIKSAKTSAMLAVLFRLVMSAVLSWITMTRKGFHVRKSPLYRERKVFDANAIETDPAKLVEHAAGWADALWNKVHVGLGDTQEAAMHRAEQRYGISAQTFWALRYRRPKEIGVSIYMRLMLAYNAECERQEAKLAHQLEVTKKLAPTPARLALITETEALLGPGDRQEVTDATSDIFDDDEPTWSSD